MKSSRVLDGMAMSCITLGVVLMLLAALMCGSGCATGYMQSRCVDAMDVFTCSVGVGGGAKARIGPVRAGLFINHDVAGLRGGRFSRYPSGGEAILRTVDFDAVVVSQENFVPDTAGRHKEFMAVGLVGLSRVSMPDGYCGTNCLARYHAPAYYGQVEVALGVGGTLRLGFNVVELLDFGVGWLGFDFLRDDAVRSSEW